MNDILWHAERQSSQLQQFLDEIQGVWSDQNSRDIQVRFLSPHRGDTDQMLTSFKGQDASLEQAGIKLKAAQTARAEALRAEAELSKHLKYNEEETRKSLYEHEIFATYNRTARLQLPQIQQLIDKANEAGR